MKLVLMSDSHNLHEQVKMPAGDVLIHAGDLTMGGKHYEVEAFIDWLQKQPYEHKIVVAGNHDFLFQRKPELAHRMLAHHGIHYLEDKELVLNGIKFYGSPWQPWFFDWAFNLQRGAEIKEKWDMIPLDTDVLITHGPPMFTDEVLDKTLHDNEHVGCEELSLAVDRVKPYLHVFGHIHPGRGYQHIDKTRYFNATVVNEEYKVVHEPYVVDLNTEEVFEGGKRIN